jgi:hypothetical protein
LLVRNQTGCGPRRIVGRLDEMGGHHLVRPFDPRRADFAQLAAALPMQRPDHFHPIAQEIRKFQAASRRHLVHRGALLVDQLIADLTVLGDPLQHSAHDQTQARISVRGADRHAAGRKQ